MKRFCFFLVAFSLVASAATAQSLAEIAKQEEARRKAVKTPGKVYTDKDLAKGGASSANSVPAPVPAAGAPGAGTPAAPGAPGQPPAGQQEPEKDEAWWKGRMTELQNKLARAKLQADAMQTRINSLTNDWANRDNPIERQQLAQDRANALGELQRLKDEIDATTKAIADLEEEARQAGVPPGWLR
jgi:hypothetical protein